jgi:hypothetical protein
MAVLIDIRMFERTVAGALWAHVMRYSLSMLVASIAFPKLSAAPLQALGLEVVALSGSPAPGAPTPLFFDSFNSVLNNHGEIAFVANLTDGAGAAVDQDGLWIVRKSGVELVAFGDQMPPGYSSPESLLPRVSQFVLNDGGDLAFISQTPARPAIERASQLWTYIGGAYHLVVDSRQQAPEAPLGARIERIGNMRFNDAGRLVYSAELLRGPGGVTADDHQGVWSVDEVSTSLLARTGDVAPGTAGLARYFVFGDVALSDTGASSIEVWLDLPVMDSPAEGRRKGIWTTAGSQSLLPVVQTFDAAPSAGTTFAGFADVTTAGDGGLGFLSAFPENMPGPTQLNNQGVWIENDAGDFQLVARSGHQAPDTPPGVYFEYFDEILVNSAGDAAFYGNLWHGSGGIGSENSTSVWLRDRHGETKLVVREGDQALGIAPGVVIDSIDGGGFSLNEAGQVAFNAGLSAGQSGVWATDRNSILHLILTSGEVVEVTPGDVRTVSTVTFWSGEGSGAGLSNGFNDLGQLVLRVQFTDGSSGTFISNIVAIPEPRALLVMLPAQVGLVDWLRRARRRAM